MNGLEIIERIAVKEVTDLDTICIILGTFSILIPTFATYLLTKSFPKSIIMEAICGIIYIVFASILMSSGVLDKPTGEYQYRVKITEDVGYVEFTDKYDVVEENDDGTYIVQEKSD